MWGDSHHLGRGRATLGLPLTLAASCLPQFTPPLPPAPSAEVVPEAKLLRALAFAHISPLLSSPQSLQGG